MVTEKSKKYDTILINAMEIFRQYGFRKASVEEICEKAGVSKMTFYKDFQNKHELAGAVLNKIVSKGLQEFDEIMHRPVSFPEKLSDIIQLKHRQQSKVGQLFLDDILSDPVLKEYLQKIQDENTHISLELFELGRREGVFRPEVTANYFIYLLGVFSNLYQDTGMARLFPDMHARTDEVMKLFFYGISKSGYSGNNGGKE